MGLARFKAGSNARITCDAQGDLAPSVVGRKCKILGRVPRMDVDGDKAYAGVPEGRAGIRTVWESELSKIHK